MKNQANDKTCFYGGKQIKVLNQKSDLVPKKADKIFIPTREKRALAVAIKNNLSALLVGETGTGKTSAIREIAYIRKQSYTRISMTGYSTPDELIGSKGIKNKETFWEHGVLTKAMIDGHLCVLDEINATAPDCMFLLHGLLDEDRRITLPNGDIITPHKDFRFFATMNRDYEGTKSLNRAFLDRFPVVVQFEYPPVITEEKIIKRELEINGVLHKGVKIRDMITVAHLGRKAYSSMKTLTPISTRSLLQWANLVRNGINSKDAFVLSICNKAVGDEQEAFMDFYNSVFKVASSFSNSDKMILIKNGKINRYEKDIDKLKIENITLSNKNSDLSKKLRMAKNELKQSPLTSPATSTGTSAEELTEKNLKEVFDKFQKSGIIDPKDIPF